MRIGIDIDNCISNFDDVLLEEFVMPLVETKFTRRKCKVNSLYNNQLNKELRSICHHGRHRMTHNRRHSSGPVMRCPWLFRDQPPLSSQRHSPHPLPQPRKTFPGSRVLWPLCPYRPGRLP